MSPMRDYEHIKCKCGGIIGSYDRGDTYTCEKCGSEYPIYKLEHNICHINPCTGWIFPMKKKQEVK